MIHSRWSGTHYEAGLSYGQALREQGIDPFVHFRQSKARLAFTRASIPLYETFYPAVLDEIWGMADGAGLDRDTVATFCFRCTVLRHKFTVPALHFVRMEKQCLAETAISLPASRHFVTAPFTHWNTHMLLSATRRPGQKLRIESTNADWLSV